MTVLNVIKPRAFLKYNYTEFTLFAVVIMGNVYGNYTRNDERTWYILYV